MTSPSRRPASRPELRPLCLRRREGRSGALDPGHVTFAHNAAQPPRSGHVVALGGVNRRSGYGGLVVAALLVWMWWRH